MKNGILIMLLISGMFLVCSCGEKSQDTKTTESSILTSDVQNEDSDDLNNEKEESEPQKTEIKVIATSITSQTNDKITTSQTQTQTTVSQTSEIQEVFEVDENGAVILEPVESVSESDLISAGQVLYEQACITEYKFHVRCPYNLDYNSSIEGNYGWQYSLVTDEGYNTISDVEEDYYKIFAESYGNDLSQLYMEHEGRLYALDGERGSNIFYDSSKITSIIEQNENEIVFEVENYYTGNDMSPNVPVTEKERFSVIINNGEWRVGQFHLPY